MSVIAEDEDNDSIQVSLSEDAPASLRSQAFFSGMLFTDYRLDTSTLGDYTFSVYGYDGSDATEKTVNLMVVTEMPTPTVPPTATPLPPTVTPVLPTATLVPPTDTPVPPTATLVPPTDTPELPTDTPVPPTATPVPPTATETPTPTKTTMPELTITPTPTPVPPRQQLLTVTDNGNTAVDLCNGTDYDSMPNTILAIRSDLTPASDTDLSDIKDIHVQVRMDGEGEFVYLGRTDSGTAQALIWEAGSQLVHPDFRVGPLLGHSYEFRALALTESGIPKSYGPYYSAGPVELKPAITVEDNPATTEDMSNGQDYDSRFNRQLTVSWNLDSGSADSDEIADFHVYVSINGGSYLFLGRPGNSVATQLNWSAGGAGAIFNPMFLAGPQFGNTYTFRVYAITASGTPLFYGPFVNAGPVEYFPLVTVTDNILTLEDLSNGQDQDAPDNRQLVIRYNFESQAELDINNVSDYHVYVKVGDGNWTFLGRNGSATATEFVWDEKMIIPLSNLAFINGPQFGQSYQFRVYPITVSGSPVFYGPFESAGPVEFLSSG